MVFIEYSLDELAEKFGICPVEYSCENCGEENKTDIPYITKQSIGLMLRNCKNCGEVMDKVTFLPKSNKKQKELMKMLSGLEE